MAEKKPKELYKERYERITTTISLKEPDRVPIAPFSHFYASNQQGLTNKEAMYHPEKLSEANINTFKSLHWDMVPPLVFSLNGNIFDSLGLKFFKWPGAYDKEQRLKENEPFQFVEGEYMKANEYKEFFTDPTGFILRKILPRHYSNLKGFANFPNFLSLCNGYMMHLHFSLFYGLQSTKKIIESLEQTTKLLLKWIQIILNYSKEMKKL
ncbi:MAG: hypothetical protein ACFFAO_17945, partial [Candidatus Hermodarchaeota archaeon]